MSWPHILSFSRVIVGPIVAALVLGPPGDAYLGAAILFVLAALTDLVDGKLARLSRRSSPLGVFLDTTADKVLVTVVLVAMAVARLSPAWVAVVIVGREFLISGLRSYAASGDRIISAHAWGKGKTAITMAVIGFTLVIADGRSGGALGQVGSRGLWDGLSVASRWLLGLAAALTVISGIRYVVDARGLFQPARPPQPAGRDRRRAMGEGR